MPKRRTKKPRDLNKLAKAIVDEATSEKRLAQKPTEPKKDPAAVALGRRGGLKGGKARAEKLSAIERKAIAQKAAASRWRKTKRS